MLYRKKLMVISNQGVQKIEAILSKRRGKVKQSYLFIAKLKAFDAVTRNNGINNNLRNL